MIRAKVTAMRKQTIWGIFTVLVLVVLLYPENLTVAPAYHVKVLDRTGAPIAGAVVSELWRQTSVQKEDHLEQVVANMAGEVDLPARTVRAPIAERLLGCFAFHSRAGWESSCGNHFTISVAGDQRELWRTEVVTGVLKKQRSLTITMEHLSPDDSTQSAPVSVVG